jgi:hypothetical protein
VEGGIEVMGFAPWKVNAAVNMATVATDGHIVATTAKGAVRGFAKSTLGLA